MYLQLLVTLSQEGENTSIRASAIAALGENGTRAAYIHLKDTARHSPNKVLRHAAIITIGNNVFLRTDKLEVLELFDILLVAETEGYIRKLLVEMRSVTQERSIEYIMSQRGKIEKRIELYERQQDE